LRSLTCDESAASAVDGGPVPPLRGWCSACAVRVPAVEPAAGAVRSCRLHVAVVKACRWSAMVTTGVFRPESRGWCAAVPARCEANHAAASAESIRRMPVRSQTPQAWPTEGAAVSPLPGLLRGVRSLFLWCLVSGFGCETRYRWPRCGYVPACAAPAACRRFTRTHRVPSGTAATVFLSAIVLPRHEVGGRQRRGTARRVTRSAKTAAAAPAVRLPRQLAQELTAPSCRRCRSRPT